LCEKKLSQRINPSAVLVNQIEERARGSIYLKGEGEHSPQESFPLPGDKEKTVADASHSHKLGERARDADGKGRLTESSKKESTMGGGGLAKSKPRKPGHSDIG